MATPTTGTSMESRKIRGFRHHLIAYVLVTALLVVINVATGGPYWVLWVTGGWGIGLLAHGFFALRPRAQPGFAGAARP